MFFFRLALASLILGIFLTALNPCFASATETEYESFLEQCEKEDWNKALSQINVLLSKRKNDADLLAGRSRVYISLGRYKQAYLDASRALKIAPRCFSALRRRGYCSLIFKRYRDGIKDLTVCIENGSGSDHEIVFPFKDYFNRGKAYEFLKQSAKSKSDFRMDRLCKQLDKALNYRKSSQLKPGIKTASSVIQADKNFILAYPVRGLLELNLGANKEAIKDFSRYLIKYPKTSQFLYYRADAYMETGDFKKAIVDLTSILKLCPKLAAFDKTANTGRMREHFTFQDRNPVNMADVCFLRGTCYLSVNDYANAKRDFTKVTKMDPSEWEAFYQRGSIWYHLKNYKLAILDFTKTLYLKPKFYKALVERARSFEKLNDIDKAVGDLTTVVKNHKNEPGAFLLRGQLFERKGLFSKAASDFTKVIQLSPSDDDGYRCRADLYLKNGLYSQAISDYRKALSLSDEDRNVILKSIRKAKGRLEKQ